MGHGSWPNYPEAWIDDPFPICPVRSVVGRGAAILVILPDVPVSPVLSHVDTSGGRRVGRYGVDLSGFERYLETVPFLSPHTDMIIIDEIGRMEYLSAKFTRLVVDLLDAPVTVVATIALHGRGIIDNIKGRADGHLYQVTRENRHSLVGEIEKAVRAGLARRT